MKTKIVGFVCAISLLLGITTAKAQDISLSKDARYQQNTVLSTSAANMWYGFGSSSWGNELSVLTTKDYKEQIFDQTMQGGRAQILYGVTYIKGPVKFGLGAGVEKKETYHPLCSATFGFQKESLRFLGTFDKATVKGSYYWNTELVLDIKKMSAGIMSKRFYGTGAKVSYQICKYLEVTGACLYDTDDGTVKPVLEIKVTN